MEQDPRAVPADARPDVPLLLLDVDGVLNVLDPQQATRAGRATAYGRSYRICWRPEVVERLVGWHRAGALELQWLTTWGHEADAHLAPLLGMPSLVVAGTHLDEPEAGRARGAGLAAQTPSAPTSGRWWKHDVVQRVLVGHPQRRVVWVDDELQPGTWARAWADAEPRLLAVGPDPRTGLTDADLDLIEEETG